MLNIGFVWLYSTVQLLVLLQEAYISKSNFLLVIARKHVIIALVKFNEFIKFKTPPII